MVSKGVSNKNAIGVFRVFPFHSDGFQVWLADSEIPWGTGCFRERWVRERKGKRKKTYKVRELRRQTGQEYAYRKV